jgi:hypothetical protein
VALQHSTNAAALLFAKKESKDNHKKKQNKNDKNPVFTTSVLHSAILKKRSSHNQ